LKFYIQGLAGEESSLTKNDCLWDFLDKLKYNYYESGTLYSRRLDTLNRSELLALIHNLNLNINNQHVTTSEFLESVIS